MRAVTVIRESDRERERESAQKLCIFLIFYKCISYMYIHCPFLQINIIMNESFGHYSLINSHIILILLRKIAS